MKKKLLTTAGTGVGIGVGLALVFDQIVVKGYNGSIMIALDGLVMIVLSTIILGITLYGE